jgi:hypothetical protein
MHNSGDYGQQFRRLTLRSSLLAQISQVLNGALVPCFPTTQISNHRVLPGGSALSNPPASFVAFARNSVEGETGVGLGYSVRPWRSHDHHVPLGSSNITGLVHSHSKSDRSSDEAEKGVSRYLSRAEVEVGYTSPGKADRFRDAALKFISRVLAGKARQPAQS